MARVGDVLTDSHSITGRGPRLYLGSIGGVGNDYVLGRCWQINHADWQPLWRLKALWPADPKDTTVPPS